MFIRLSLEWILCGKGLIFTNVIHFYFVALSVQSSGGDSWTKQVSYTGSEPNSEVVCPFFPAVKK